MRLCANSGREERTEQFNEVRDAAVLYLKQPHSLPKAAVLDSWEPILLLWHFPSFAAHRSWTICRAWKRDSIEATYLVRQVVWDRPADADRFFNPLVGLAKGWHPEPTIEVRDRPLDCAAVEDRLVALYALSIPAFAHRPGIHLDGETHGLELPNRGTRLEWANSGPESWETFTGWVDELRTWLTEATSVARE